MEIAPFSEGTDPLISLGLSLLIVGTMMYSTLNIIDKKSLKLKVLLLIVLGAISREMMGFSATIYASRMRTFTIMSFCLAISGVMLTDSIEDKKMRVSIVTPALILLLF